MEGRPARNNQLQHSRTDAPTPKLGAKQCRMVQLPTPTDQHERKRHRHPSTSNFRTPQSTSLDISRPFHIAELHGPLSDELFAELACCTGGGNGVQHKVLARHVNTILYIA